MRFTKTEGSSLAQEDEDPAVAERLRRLRLVFAGDNQAAFARWVDVPPSRWNMVEHGAPLSKQLAFQLRRKITGLSLDWLFFGDAGGLSVQLAKRLDLLPRLSLREDAGYPPVVARVRKPKLDDDPVETET
jgi:hypothetical protein